ncbi:protein GLE1 [Citrus sinensis]|uniref:Protein GLE1 n=1 Tax=Citrus sinensis TaxID=2711 RepID=A0ACB8LHF9_CITSI|nr:protein GLE1 [Citrus sinensis]
MYRGAIKLELRCPQKVDGIAIDPEPDWSFDALLSELNSLETRLNASSKPVPFTKTKSREISTGKSVESNARAFVIRVSDDELENDNERKGEEVHNGSLVAVKRFTCDALYLSESDDSDDDVTLGGESYLMDEVGLADGALVELTHQHQLGVKEEIRNLISTLETQLISENEQSNSALAQVEKDRDMRREMDRKNDTVYQRKIAEALDNHLTAVQRDHELKSQIEERKIRSDAAYEEAKRKERALQEEKIRQEKVKAEAEMQAKLRAEEAKRAALEAEKRAAKEAAEREAAENSKRITAGVSQDGARGRQPDDSSVIAGAQSRGSRSDGTKKLQSADFSSSDVGSTVRATESALNIEQKRLQKLKELDEENQSLKLSSNEDFSGYEKDISRLIRQIRGLKDNVRTKASELVKIFNNPLCPQSISLATFSKKVVSRCETPDDNVAMSCGYVIVLVASQVPQVMDILLGEFHRACIYTAAFESEEAYYKTIGYREEDGKIESLENYLSRLKSYMRLYAALIQTEIPGVQNAHGLKEGWAWLARFLNALPANIYTAVALNAFLQLAGFALFKKYKSQFRKILDNIYDNFLNALKAREDSKLNLVIAEIQYYIEDKKFLEEPEGRTLQAPPLSSTLVPEADYQEYGRYHQYQEYGYQYH